MVTLPEMESRPPAVELMLPAEESAPPEAIWSVRRR